MERIIDRLDQWMSTTGKNDNRVTAECELSVGLLNKARSGKSDLGKKTVNKILKKYQDINPAWLLSGEGEMFNRDSATSASQVYFSDRKGDFSSMKPGIYERMLHLLDMEGVSIEQYEKNHNIIRGTFNNAIKRADKKITYGWVTGFLDDYPKYSLDWIIFGEGEPLRGNRQMVVKDYSIAAGVPYYAVDFLAGFDLVMNDQTAKPDGYVSFPNIRGAEAWVDISGKSMSPLIDPGDVIALKKVEDWTVNILYGEVYALVTDQYRTVKRIRKSDREGWIRLVPENPEYDPQDIPATSVRAVFQVLGCAKKIF